MCSIPSSPIKVQKQSYTSLVLAPGRAVPLPAGGVDNLVLPASLHHVDGLQVFVQSSGDAGVQWGAAQALHLPQQSHNLRSNSHLTGLHAVLIHTYKKIN